MAKVNEFDNILNECLDRLMKGGTVESCLHDYPQYAAELKPILTVAQDTRVVSTFKPRPEFRQRAANEFQAALRDLPVKKPGMAFKWQLRWAMPVAIILVLLISGTGTVAAATNALPDSPLYSIKMAAESVQMAFTFSDEGKAELFSRFVDYRVEEIVKMVEKGDVNLINTTTDLMNNHLLEINNLGLSGNAEALVVNYYGDLVTMEQSQLAAPPDLGDGKDAGTTATQSVPYTTDRTFDEPTDADLLIQRLLDDMDRNLQILREQLAIAPRELRAAIQHAIDVIEANYWQVISNLSQ